MTLDNLHLGKVKKGRNKEFYLFFIFSLVVSIIFVLPYIYAYWITPPDLFFKGSIARTHDQNIYFMWFKQVAEGKILLQNLYTAIPHDGAMFNFFLLAVGGLAYFFKLPLGLCYLLARFFSSVFLCLSLYYFISLFFARSRRLFPWLAVLTWGGLGWTILMLTRMGYEFSQPDTYLLCMDLKQIEVYPFTAGLYQPLLAVAMGFLVLTLRFVTLAFLHANFKRALQSGLCLFLMSFIHPYEVINVYIFTAFIFLIFAFNNQFLISKFIKITAVIFLCGLPSVGYNYWILNTNPGFDFWRLQNICPGPPLHSALLGLGIPFLGGICWLVIFMKKQQWDSPYILIAIWIITFPLYLYSHLNFESRLSTGLIIPFTIGTCLIIENKSKILFSLIFFLASLTNSYQYIHSWRTVKNFLPYSHAERCEVEIYEVLSKYPVGVVLSQINAGTLIPRFAMVPVVFGAAHQTDNFEETKKSVEDFYSGKMDNDQRNHFIAVKNVKYIFYGPDERRLDQNCTLPIWLKKGWEELPETKHSPYKIYKKSELPQ
jgi:hypothetical protein